MSPGAALGVDFGTSNTVAVVRWPDGRARPLLVDGSPLLPVGGLRRAGRRTLVVGRDAVHSARLDPARFEPNPKRRVDDGRVLLGDREVPVVDLVAAVLGRVAEEWRRAVRRRCRTRTSTLTCPATWGATRRGAALRRRRRGPGWATPGWSPSRSPRPPTSPRCSAATCRSARSWWCTTSAPARSTRAWWPAPPTASRCWPSTAATTSAGSTSTRRSSSTWRDLRAGAPGGLGAAALEPATVEDRRAQRQLWDDVRVAKERLSRSPVGRPGGAAARRRGPPDPRRAGEAGAADAGPDRAGDPGACCAGPTCRRAAWPGVFLVGGVEPDPAGGHAAAPRAGRGAGGDRAARAGGRRGQHPGGDRAAGQRARGAGAGDRPSSPTDRRAGQRHDRAARRDRRRSAPVRARHRHRRRPWPPAPRVSPARNGNGTRREPTADPLADRAGRSRPGRAARAGHGHRTAASRPTRFGRRHAGRAGPRRRHPRRRPGTTSRAVVSRAGAPHPPAATTGRRCWDKPRPAAPRAAAAAARSLPVRARPADRSRCWSRRRWPRRWWRTSYGDRRRRTGRRPSMGIAAVAQRA